MSYAKEQAVAVMDELHKTISYSDYCTVMDGLQEIDTLRDRDEELEELWEQFGIVKGFRLGISRDDLDAMRLAYECMVNPGFYRQLGRDPAAEIKRGIGVLVRLYGSEGR